MVNRRNNNNINNLKDYIIPIIGIFLILFLIYSFFNSISKKTINEVENKIGINISIQTDNTNAKIYYPGGGESELVNKSVLYKGEKISVSEGRVKVEKKGEYDFNIDKIGELKYSSNNKFTISSGKIWLNTKKPIDITMKHGKVKVHKGSHISFSQNDFTSTIYLISGMAEVSNNAGNSIVLKNNEEIEISGQNTMNEDFNLSIEKKSLSDYFKNTPWFTINNGNNYLIKPDDKDNSSTGSTENKNYISNDDIITFGNLLDESHVSASSIDIYGNYTGNIGKILVNNENEANLNKENNTFNFDSVSVSNKTNDLVFKVYDDSNNLLEKLTYTVYYDAGKASKTKIKSTKFDADGSDFIFTAPSSEETYTTYDNIVTIKGKVKDSSITRITVNEYQLTSFNGSTWRYFAKKETLNLEEGTNRYEIKYYNGEKLVYTNYYTIVKKTGVVPNKLEN